MPIVARLNVTPVKSTSLLHPEEISLGVAGVAEDRRFLFLGPDHRRLSGLRKAALLGVHAAYDAATEELRFQLPDGAAVEGSARATGDVSRVELFDRAVDVRPVPGPFAEMVSQHLGFEVTLARVEAPERAGGVHPVSVVSLASVDELGARGGVEGRPDPRRFRMLFELEDCAPHEEDTWSERQVRFGEATVRIHGAMPRCVVTTLHPDTGQPDFPALEVLATYRRLEGQLMFGVCADVVEPGKVRVGDLVEVR